MLNLKKIRDIMRNDAGVNGDAQRIEQIVWILFLKAFDYYEKVHALRAMINSTSHQSALPEEIRWDNWAEQWQKDELGRYILNENKNKLPNDAKTGPALIDFVDKTLIPTLRALPQSTDMPVFAKMPQRAFDGINNYMKDGFLLRRVINEINELSFSTTQKNKQTITAIYEAFLKELQDAGKAGEFYTPRAVTDFCMQILKPKIGDKIADLACGTGGFLTSAYHYMFKDGNHAPSDIAMINKSFFGVEKKQLPYILCATNFLLNGIDKPNLEHKNAFDFEDFEELYDKPKFDIIAMNPPYGGSEKGEYIRRFPALFRSNETADLFMALITERLAAQGQAAVVLPDGFLFGTDTAKINLKKRLLSEFNLHLIVRLPKTVFAPYTGIATNILFFIRNTQDDRDPLGTEFTHFYRLDMPPNIKSFGKTKPMKIEHFEPFWQWDKNGRPDLPENDGTNFKAKKYTRAELENSGYNFDLCGFVSESEEILAPAELIAQIKAERDRLNTTLDSLLSQIQTIIKEHQ